ncbi:hypothetical protein ACFPN2_26280 [Steroidobacter flavus]|uniref:Uncharacterized protein n=1 Tax=Steroidobacter flavus TaxID=1842136 RepID=A0ABV8SYE8_9GAMM
MAKHESPSALLIISAIDLLLASLVCGVVLFVALVGAHGRSSDEQTGDAAQAPIPITLLYLVDPVPGEPSSNIQVANAARVGKPQDASAESLEHSGFKIDARIINSRHWRGDLSSPPPPFREDKYRWASFKLNPGKKAVSIENIPTVAYAAVHLGKRGSYYIWMRCAQEGWKLDLALDPVTVLDDTCANRSDAKGLRPTEAPPKPFLIVSDQPAPAPDWIFLSRLPSKTGGAVSQWHGPSADVPLDVSTALFTY